MFRQIKICLNKNISKDDTFFVFIKYIYQYNQLHLFNIRKHEQIRTRGLTFPPLKNATSILQIRARVGFGQNCEIEIDKRVSRKQLLLNST